MSLGKLEEKLGYTFIDRAVLLLALTHKSFGHEVYADRPLSQKDNERLEFLGDSILSLVISDWLLESFPHHNEGQLSRLRAALVNEKALAMVARCLGLKDFVRLGKGEMQTSGWEKSSILAGTFEALVAAVYLDGGFQEVKKVVCPLFETLFREGALGSLSVYDPKTRLQEWAQSQWKVSPSYHLKNCVGPDHAKIFEIEVKLGEKTLAVALGHSKKEAEQKAAEVAMLGVTG